MDALEDDFTGDESFSGRDFVRGSAFSDSSSGSTLQLSIKKRKTVNKSTHVTKRLKSIAPDSDDDHFEVSLSSINGCQ